MSKKNLHVIYRGVLSRLGSAKIGVERILGGKSSRGEDNAGRSVEQRVPQPVRDLYGFAA
jgi:hypothetical protein